MHDETELIIPDYDPYNPKSYPGDIEPGTHSKPPSKEVSEKTELDGGMMEEVELSLLISYEIQKLTIL